MRRGGYTGGRTNTGSRISSSSYRGNVRGSNSKNNRTRNPPDQYGQITRCNICESTMHYAKDCPHKDSETYYEDALYQVVLFESDLEQPHALPDLIKETLSAAVLDCGAVEKHGSHAII